MPPRGYRKEKPTFRCELCTYTSQRLSCFNDHLRVHSGEKPFECAVCGKGFTQKSNLGQHMKVHGAGADHVFKCTQKDCDFTTKWKSSLLIHERWHQGDRPYQCALCEKTFTQSTHCRTHMRESHGNERRFQCDECPKSFKRSDHLTRHVAYHKAEKKCECDICGKRFVDTGGLRSHRRTHEGDAGKRYRCDRCPYRTFFKQCLDVHYRIHLGVKPYTCAHCNKTFRTSSSVKIHIRMVHQGDEGKIFHCQLCAFSTANNQSLKNHHRRIHEGYKERAWLKCMACGKVYTTRSSYYSHRRKVHPKLPRIDAIYRRDKMRDSDKSAPAASNTAAGVKLTTSKPHAKARRGPKVSSSPDIPNITYRDVVYFRAKGDKVENMTVRIPSSSGTGKKNKKKERKTEQGVEVPDVVKDKDVLFPKSRREKGENKTARIPSVAGDVGTHKKSKRRARREVKATTGLADKAVSEAAAAAADVQVPKRSPRSKQLIPVGDADVSPNTAETPKQRSREKKKEKKKEKKTEQSKIPKIVLKTKKETSQRKKKEKFGKKKEEKPVEEKSTKPKSASRRRKRKADGDLVAPSAAAAVLEVLETEGPIKRLKSTRRRKTDSEVPSDPRTSDVPAAQHQVDAEKDSDEGRSSAEVSPSAVPKTNRRKSSTPKKSTGPRFSPVVTPERETAPPLPTQESPTSEEPSLVQIAPIVSMKAYNSAGIPIHIKFVPVLAQSSDGDGEDAGSLSTSEVCAAIQKGAIDFAARFKDDLVSSGVRVASTSEFTQSEHVTIPNEFNGAIAADNSTSGVGMPPGSAHEIRAPSVPEVNSIPQDALLEENNNELIPLEPLDLSISSARKVEQNICDNDSEPKRFTNLTPVELPVGKGGAEAGWAVPDGDLRKRGRAPRHQ